METDKTKDASEIQHSDESKEPTKTGETIRKNEPTSTSSTTSSSPNKDKAKGIPVGIAAYAAAAAAAAARAAAAKVKTSDDKITDEAGKVDQPKSGLFGLVSYSRSPSTSPVGTDDEDSKSAISSKSVAKITSPITMKETKEVKSTINPGKLDDSKKIVIPSSSNVERKMISLKPSGVSPIKPSGVSLMKPSGVSPMKPSGVSPIKPSGVSPSIKPPGVSPSIKPPGVSPSIKPPGVSPSIKPSGVSPSIKPSGVSPSIKPSGVSPSMKPSGVSPSMKPSGVSPSMKPSGVSPIKPSGVSLPIKPSGVLPIKPFGVLSIKPSGVSPIKPSGVSPIKPSGVSLPLKPSGVSLPIKPSGVSLPIKPSGVSPIKPSGVSPMKMEASKNLVKPPNIERKIISLKPSGVSPIKPSGVSPIEPSGVSPMKIEASKNVVEPEISIPKVEALSTKQNVSISVDKTKITPNKINESSQSTSVNIQSLAASRKGIDSKVNPSECLEKERDTSRSIKMGTSPLPKTESTSNIIKYATSQVTDVSIKPKVVSESDKAFTKQVSQPNISKTSSQIKMPIVFSSSSENKSEKEVAPDTTPKVVPLSADKNRLENILAEKSKFDVSKDVLSVSKVGDLNKTEILSSKLGAVTATPIKDKSLEVKVSAMKDKSPEVRDTPMKEKSPGVKDAPMIKKSQEVKDSPMKDKSPEVKDTPMKDKSTKVKDNLMKEKSTEVKDTPMIEKSPEDKEKTEKAEKTTHLEASQQMMSTSVSQNLKKSFPTAGASSTMPVYPNQGKKEAIKRPCPEANEENEIPEKREKIEVIDKEKVMEVKDVNSSNSASEVNLEKNLPNNVKEIKEDAFSNGDKADEDSNDIEMKDESNDMDTKDEESLDDMDIDKVQRQENIDETETPSPSEVADEEFKNDEEEEEDDDEDEDDDVEEEADDEKKDEDYDDEEVAPTRSSRRKKPKPDISNRQRGYGGKFLPDTKKPELSALLDENARMDMDEDSQSSIATPSKPKRAPRYRCEVINPESTEEFTAEKVVEYVWPLEGNGEHYFLQEQISQYLDIKSLKRKYPDLRRRQIEMHERDYLKEKGYVSEMACDLGLTPVRSEDVLDVMCNDFPNKFEELSALMREKQEKEMREKGKVDYSLANIDKSKMQEYARKAAEQAAKWNSNLNRERKEERKYSFDLSSFTLHITKGRQKILPAEYTKMGSYPVSVLPGQYTDSYRRYSPAALHTLPLSTVTADPLNEHDGLGSDGEDSAPEEEMKPLPIFSEMPWIYSKGANTPNKENVTGNSSGAGGVRRGDFEIDFKIQVAEYAQNHTNAQAERKFQTSEANVRRWKQQLDALRKRAQETGFSKGSEKPAAGPKCKHCAGNRQENKAGRPEPMLTCATCKCHTHLTCVDLTTVMIPKLESYKWQCIDCKTCMQCNDPDDAEKMIFCDMCDRGYHIYCVGLKKVPNGRWQCKECAICSSCKSRTPQGDEHIKNAEWQHEFKKDEAKQLRYAATLCIPCDRFWKKRQFCYICTRVYKSVLEDKMVRCANCPKFIHKDGCSTVFENEIFCNICYKSRNSSALNHSRIIAAAKKKMARSY